MHLFPNEEGFLVTMFLLLLCLVLDLVGTEEAGSWDLSAGHCLHDACYDIYSKSDMFFQKHAIFDFAIVASVYPQPRRVGKLRSMRCSGMLR
jgi:hypothetical protein